MLLFKKLALIPFFLIVFAILIYKISPLLKSYDFLFSLSFNTFIDLLIISALITISSFLFVLFVSVCMDWRIVFGSAAVVAALSIILGDPALSLVLFVAILVSLWIASLTLENGLKSYLTFSPSALLGPSIRNLSGLLILSFCIVYFLSANRLVAQNGFQIPDSLIDTALKFTPTDSSTQEQPAQPSLNSSQIDLLKKNPDLVKQYGLDPNILNSLSKPVNALAQGTNNLIKQTVKDQINNFLKPYLGFIPAVLALLLFLSLQSITAIINILVNPLLMLTFYILEKTNFIHFETEMREVKKLVV